MKKPVYEVHVDASLVRDGLADIERGNPQRMLKFRTFTDAWALANVVRFAAGLSMLRKPRGQPWPGCVAVYSPSDPDACIVVKIVRRTNSKGE